MQKISLNFYHKMGKDGSPSASRISDSDDDEPIANLNRSRTETEGREGKRRMDEWEESKEFRAKAEQKEERKDERHEVKVPLRSGLGSKVSWVKNGSKGGRGDEPKHFKRDSKHADKRATRDSEGASGARRVPASSNSSAPSDSRDKSSTDPKRKVVDQEINLRKPAAKKKKDEKRVEGKRDEERDEKIDGGLVYEESFRLATCATLRKSMGMAFVQAIGRLDKIRDAELCAMQTISID